MNDKNFLAGLIATLILAIVFVATVVPIVVVNGYVLYLMWGWFLVPLGVPAIGLAHAIGIDAIITLVTPVATQKESASLQKVLSIALLKPVLMLATGYVATLFM